MEMEGWEIIVAYVLLLSVMVAVVAQLLRTGELDELSQIGKCNECGKPPQNEEERIRNRECKYGFTCDICCHRIAYALESQPEVDLVPFA